MGEKESRFLPRDIMGLGKLEKGIYFVYPTIAAKVLFITRDIRNSEYTPAEIENIIVELENEIRKDQSAYNYIYDLLEVAGQIKKEEEPIVGIETKETINIKSNETIEEEYKGSSIKITEYDPNKETIQEDKEIVDDNSSHSENRVAELESQLAKEKSIYNSAAQEIESNKIPFSEIKDMEEAENQENTEHSESSLQIYEEVVEGNYIPLFSNNKDINLDLYFMMKDFFLGGLTPRNYKRLGNSDEEVITALITDLVNQEERGRR